MGVPYPLLIVCRTACKDRKAPGKTAEALSLIKGKDPNDPTALLANRAGGLKVSRQGENYYD
jgi:hypothetical protein